MLLLSLAGLNFAYFKFNADAERWAHKASAAEGEVTRLKSRVSALEDELVEKSDRAMRLEAEKAAREQMANPSGLTCQVMVLEWTARVEGEAGLPPLTMKRLTQGKHIPKDEQRRLARAIEKYPPPDCVEGA